MKRNVTSVIIRLYQMMTYGDMLVNFTKRIHKLLINQILVRCVYIATSNENLNTNVDNALTNKIITLTEDEQNFEEVYEKFTKSKSRITCYFCNYISKYRILFNIQGEIHEHLRSEHKDIVNSYNPDTYQFDNDQQEDFLDFFVDSCNLWIMGNRPGRWY